VVLDPCAGSSGQAWAAVKSGSNYTFHPANNTALCLDVAGAGTASGTLVQAYTCNATSAQSWALSTPGSGGGGGGTGARIVGYLPDYDGDYATFAKTLSFNKMTHLMIGFALPPGCNGTCTASSNMAFSMGQSDASIATLVNAAHAAGVKVMVTIGGGENSSDDLISAFYNVGLSSQLVNSLDSYVTSHNLDGVDVDFEDPGNMGAPYATFVSDLIAKEHGAGRLVSAAVAEWLQTQNVMSNATLQSYDFINVMVYSNLSDCQSNMSYFASLGEPANKMTVGVPFYGQSSDASETYAQIIAVYPNAGASNSVSGNGALDNGNTISYVGDAEMAQETTFSLQYGGIMIWELSQDAAPPNSLLTVIQNNI
jgi:GH18 family chitinase